MYSPQITPFQPSNIDATTKMLMGLQQKGQLQQYVAQHKNDPNLVSLALYVSNMSKARPAVQAEANQPKVVDQAIAGMAQALPEDQGIATLPAQNMQNFAGGGIVAFDDGGPVRHFDGSRGSFVGTSSAVPAGAIIMGNMYQDPVTGKMVPLPERDALPFGNVPMNYAENKRIHLERQKEALASREKAAQSVLNESPEDYAARKVAELEAQGGKQLSPDARNMAMSQFVKDKIGGQVKRGEASFTSSNDLADPKNIYKTTPNGVADLPAGSSEDDYLAGINKLIKGSQTGGGGARTTFDAKRYDVTAPQLANATPQDMAARLAAAMGPDPTKSPLAGQQEEVNKATVASRQEYANDLAKQFEKQGEAFKGTLEKLTAKEARVQSMEDKQLGMSMFEAGLAMMSGDSPYAMVNIGKGAQVGTKKYIEIQNQVESARDKIDDAKMKIEEFRRNEANMNARELRLAKKDVNDAVSAGAQASLNLMREQYGLKHAEGLAFVTNSYTLDRFNAEQKASTNIHNQSTRAALDTAEANRKSQEGIAARSDTMRLGLAALEAKRLPPAAREAMLLGTGKTDAERYESGLRKAQEIASDKTGAVYAKLYAEHVTDARKQMTEPLSPTEFAASMRGILTAMSPKVVTAPGGKSMVYDRPK